MAQHEPVNPVEKQFGLLGQHLQHSFSPRFFNDKFLQLGLPYHYRAFELPTLQDVRQLSDQYPNLAGLNVTVPYKEAIVPYLDVVVGGSAQATGAVNTIRITPDGRWLGYNTDTTGFASTLAPLLVANWQGRALVLGTGGAAKAVQYVLQQLGIIYISVSRNGAVAGSIPYETVTPELLAAHLLVINTTPVGMYPAVEGLPLLPYAALTTAHILIDLIYNPAETRFLAEGRQRGCRTQNGYPMLVTQAEAAWTIWQAGL